MNDPSPKTGRARSPSFRVAIPVTAVLVLGAAGLWWSLRSRGILVEVALRSEGGIPRSEGGRGFFVIRQGERIRLELTVSRPAAVLVFLQDPRGAMSEVDPHPGDDARPLPGGRSMIPREAWDTAGLEFGPYLLWVLASPAPVPAGDRPAILARLQEAVRGAGWPDDLPLTGIQDALRPRIEGIAACPFAVHPAASR